MNTSTIKPFYKSPLGLVIAIGLSIFFAEAVAMGVMYYLRPFPSDFIGILIDSSLLILLLSPVFCYFGLRPLLLHINMLRKAEDKLQKAKEAILSTTMDSFFLADYKGRLMDANEPFCTLTGYGREKLLTMSIHDFEAIENPSDIARHIQQVMETGSDRFESRHNYKDGRIVEVEVSVTYKEAEKRFYAFVRDITERKKAEKTLKNSCEQIRYLASYLQTVREKERTDIAREIHDELGQSLTALKFDLMNLTRDIDRLEGQEHSAIRDKMHLISGFIDELSNQVHKIAMELRPGILDHLGLSSAIEWQLQDFKKRTGISGEYTPAVKTAVNGEIATAIFRILQEALTNVIRHANATTVEVRLKEEAGNLILEIEDNGEGFSENNLHDEHSLGILGMKERAYSHGGTLDIKSTMGAGTKVVVSVPNKEAQL
ncbi:MAG: PAS domain-containing sensor histidine kinase [Dissulfurispiraceae bacterium]|jgi:PAS domain S-box-containing protein